MQIQYPQCRTCKVRKRHFNRFDFRACAICNTEHCDDCIDTHVCEIEFSSPQSVTAEQLGHDVAAAMGGELVHAN